MRTLTAIIFIAITGLNSAHAEWSCELLMRGVSNSKIVQATMQFGTIPREVVSGKETPHWDDFDTLKQVASSFAEAKELNQQAGKLEAFESELNLIAENLKREYAHDFDYRKSAPLAQDYEAGDYELRKVFRDELRQFNQILPSRFKFQLPPLPDSHQDTAQINAQAEKLLSKQKLKLKDSAQTFDASLKESLQSKPELAPLLKLYRDFSRSQNVRLSMRRPESSRFWLPRAGFQNQRATGSSRGTFSRALRNEAEAALLNLEPEEFNQLPSELLPKYGYIRLAENNPLSITSYASTYGEDIFDFKADRIQKRSSYTVGDSLNYGLAEYDRPLGFCFTPLSYLKDALTFLRFPLVGDQTKLELFNPFPRLPYNLIYLELQIFGTLSLDDVEQFTFTRNEPSGEFLEELLARGIRIKDGRTDPDHPVDYVTEKALDPHYVPLLKRKFDEALSP